MSSKEVPKRLILFNIVLTLTLLGILALSSAEYYLIDQGNTKLNNDNEANMNS